MLDIFKQEQSLRPYYDVISVDGVRYTVDGKKQMFVSAARELPSLAFLGPKEWLRYWGSAALMYTHGFGWSWPRQSGGRRGRPVYTASNIPPHGDASAVCDAGTADLLRRGDEGRLHPHQHPHLKELDYPDEQFRITSEFPPDVNAGIPVNGIWKRIILAFHTKDLTAFLFSSFIDHSRTRVHLYRTPMRRVKRVARSCSSRATTSRSSPETDRMDGQALTTTDMYPYALREVLGDKADERAVEAFPERLVNYGEDSVKITMDAFNGDVHLYRISEDPIIRAWGPVLPGLSRRGDAMPEPVRAQLNYPLQWFHLQFDDIYKRYHMRTPRVLQRGRLWDDADEAIGSLGRGSKSTERWTK
jgi:uncharacterized membrane protein (UPF0182 family)